MREVDQRGFTLLEVLLAVGITAMVMVTVSTSFLATLQARETVASLSESTEAGPRILTLLERDLRGLWHHNVGDNRVLVGRNLDIGGWDADRIDFLTSTDSVGTVIDQYDLAQRPSICEVGYWLRDNRDIPGLMELWRREDPMVDEDLLTGGTFQLVHDRIKSFSIKYYETTGYEAEELLEWDSSQDDKLPRRIEVEFELERKLRSRNVASDLELDDFEELTKVYKRHIVFDRRYTDILQPGIAMIPVLPPPPQDSGPEGPIGGGAGGTGAGPAGGPAGAMSGMGDSGGVRDSAGGTRDRGAGREDRVGGRAQGGSTRGQTFNLSDLLRPGGGGGAGGLFPTGGRGG
jgi:prepilin-type N-terminal cleavage/methylation domain-containing protein